MTTDKNYGRVKSIEDLRTFADRLIAAGTPFGFDIETGYVGADKVKASLLPFHPDFIVAGFSFTNNTKWARYVPIAHDGADNLDSVESARQLWRLLSTGLGVAHNASFELKGLSRWFLETLSDDPEYGDAVRSAKGFYPLRSDTMIEAMLKAEFEKKDLKTLTNLTFGHAQADIYSLFPGIKPVQKKFIRFNSLELRPDVISYACEDAAWCLALHERNYPDVKDNLVYKIEMRLLPILCEMEKEGLLLDWAQYERVQHDVAAFKAKMSEDAQKVLSELTGEVVNINLNSPPQVADLLYNKLQMPIKMRSKQTQAPSTSEKAMRELAKKYDVVKNILQYREVVALESRYILKYLKELRYDPSGRAHPNHKQEGAATGRLAVDGVSYQQWPKPYHYELSDGSTFSLNYRNFLLAPDEYRIIGFDYANVELRILAGLAQEKVMLDAFNNGIDIHKATASTMLNIPLDDVTDKDRSLGKALADSEVVLTPSGWARMGDLSVGDEVVVPQGGSAHVEAVFPQGEREIFRVVFEDGAEVRADGDHLWPVRHIKTHEERLMTTRDILAAGLVLDTGKANGTWKWYIKNVSPLNLDGDSELGVDPYLLGLLLGDGSLSAPAMSLALGDEDREETTAAVSSSLPDGVVTREANDRSLVFTSRTPGAYRNPLDRELKELGLRGSKTSFSGRFGVVSNPKFVPQAYLFSGIGQRYEVLRGLMDSDGTVSADGRATFTTVSSQLAEDVIFLARSLGGRAKILRSRITTYTYAGEKRSGQVSYEVLVSTPECPFRLSRKAERWSVNNARRSARLQDKKLVGIIPDGVELATCIRVSSKEHEFVTSGVTRTHNTLNFAIVYGSGVDNIASMLGIPVPEAQKHLDKYFETFSGLKSWMDRMVVEGRQQNSVKTKFGRTFRIFEYFSKFQSVRNKGDRMCVNAPVQGAAADYMKISMVRASTAIKKAGMEDKIRLIMTVHDALEFYVHESVSTQEVIDLLSPQVSFPVEGFPEIRADWHEGYRWGSVVEVKVQDGKVLGYQKSKTEFVTTLDEAVSKEDLILNPVTDEFDPYDFDSDEDEVAVTSTFEADKEDMEPVWWNAPKEEFSPPRVLVTLSEAPTDTAFVAFRNFLETRTGEGEVVLRMPEGSLTFNNYVLTKDDQVEVSGFFGEATISLALESVSTADFLSGVTL